MPRDAASVIPVRESSSGEWEIYLVSRSKELRFFGGYHAFPGGGVESQDRRPGDDWPEEPGFDGAALRRAGVRELFEETGILAGQRGELEAGKARSFRRALLDSDREFDFWSSLEEAGVELDPGALRPLTRLVTPRFSRTRFDTRFYLVGVEEQEPEIWPGELDSGEWGTPEHFLHRWERMDISISAPTLTLLRELRGRDLSRDGELRLELRSEFEGSGQAIPWTPGVEFVPLVTPPLPEETPTSAFLVGHRRWILIDPGPRGQSEQEHLIGAMQSRIDAGDELVAIVLSHHHQDHVGALEVVREHFGAPVWAHPITGELLEIELERELDDGDRIDLGAAPDGHAPWTLEVLFTPGHARGHLAFFDAHHGSLLAGDLVSTILSMYVGSPGGHLETYFRSLERVRELEVKTLFPSHGPPTREARKLIDKNLRHRRQRIEEIRGLLGSEPQPLAEIARKAYQKIDPRWEEWFFRTTRATLECLEERGQARRHGEDVYSRA